MGLLWPSVRKERLIGDPCRRWRRVVRYFGKRFRRLDVAWNPGGCKPVDLRWTQFAEPGPEAYPRDLNNFGPAIGFCLECDLEDRASGRLPDAIRWRRQLHTESKAFSASPLGSEFIATYQGDSAHPYLDLTSITKNQVPYPIAPPVLPVQQIPLTSRTATIQAYDTNYVSPYIQNLTLSITKDVNSHLTLDARYIGTLTRKNFNSFDLNVPNFLTNGLKQAFDAARAGQDSPLLDQMFKGINIAGTGFGAVGTTLNGVPQTGALELRNNSTLSEQPRQWKLRCTGRTVGSAELHGFQIRGTRVCRLYRLASMVRCFG